MYAEVARRGRPDSLTSSLVVPESPVFFNSTLTTETSENENAVQKLKLSLMGSVCFISLQKVHC